jgi:carbamoyltransferase
MRVLGLSTMGESGAALLDDGSIVCAIEEERLSRVKHDGRFPVHAVRTCLEMSGLRLSDIDVVAVFWRPFAVGVRARHVLRTALQKPAIVRGQFERIASILKSRHRDDESPSPNVAGSWLDLFSVPRLLEEATGERPNEVIYVDHHQTHVGLSFFGAPFDSAACLVVDGGGEEDSTTIFDGEGPNQRRVDATRWPNSLGHYYSAFTGFLGFGMLDGEYKMMGLAPLGEPDFADVIRREILAVRPSGGYTLHTDVLNYHDALRGRFNPRLTGLFGPPRPPGGPLEERHMAVAASVQLVFEEAMLALARRAHRLTGRSHLCIGGGCGLNGTANGRLLRDGPFERISVPSAPHDAGCALGAALLVWTERTGRRTEVTSAKLGPAIDVDEDWLAEHGDGCAVHRLPGEHVAEHAARALAKGEVVAWARGRTEYGPRALGSRSFLAHPGDAAMKETLNAKIKHREPFRPFAPMVKAERATDYFDLPQPSPFMNIVVDVLPHRRRELGAVTHVDGSARVQTVDKSQDPDTWALLDAFEAETGLPILLNTSFNIQEPIVNTKAEALATFRRSRADLLILGDFAVRHGPDESQ